MQTRSKKLKNILSWSFVVLSVALAIFVLFLVVDAKRNDRPVEIFGRQLYFVITGSMEPDIKTNGVVAVQNIGYDSASVGDIVAFRSDLMGGQTAIHRVIEISDEGLVTKGDNNDWPDGGHVTADNYLGEVVYKTNFTASFITGIKQPGGVYRLILVPLLVIILIIVAYKLLTEGVDWRKKGLIVSLIILSISGSCFLSYGFYLHKRQNTVNQRLGEITENFMAKNANKRLFVSGKEILGVIDIPSLNLKYPIIKFNKPISLETTIAQFAGPMLNNEGNVVLVGHRSYGNLFFTKIDQLEVGAEIKITDVELNTMTYFVSGSRIAPSRDFAVVSEDTQDHYLTLMSCEYDMLECLVVWAEGEEK